MRLPFRSWKQTLVRLGLRSEPGNPTKPRRRLLAEQLEDQRLLAVAYDDSYDAHTNQPLVVDMPGPLGNDSYRRKRGERAEKGTFLLCRKAAVV